MHQPEEVPLLPLKASKISGDSGRTSLGGDKQDDSSAKQQNGANLAEPNTGIEDENTCIDTTGTPGKKRTVEQVIEDSMYNKDLANVICALLPPDIESRDFLGTLDALCNDGVLAILLADHGAAERDKDKILPCIKAILKGALRDCSDDSKSPKDSEAELGKSQADEAETALNSAIEELFTTMYGTTELEECYHNIVTLDHKQTIREIVTLIKQAAQEPDLSAIDILRIANESAAATDRTYDQTNILRSRASRSTRDYSLSNQNETYDQPPQNPRNSARNELYDVPPISYDTENNFIPQNHLPERTARAQSSPIRATAPAAPGTPPLPPPRIPPLPPRPHRLTRAEILRGQSRFTDDERAEFVSIVERDIPALSNLSPRTSSIATNRTSTRLSKTASTINRASTQLSKTAPPLPSQQPKEGVSLDALCRFTAWMLCCCDCCCFRASQEGPEATPATEITSVECDQVSQVNEECGIVLL